MHNINIYIFYINTNNIIEPLSSKALVYSLRSDSLQSPEWHACSLNNFPWSRMLNDMSLPRQQSLLEVSTLGFCGTALCVASVFQNCYSSMVGVESVQKSIHTAPRPVVVWLEASTGHRLD